MAVKTPTLPVFTTQAATSYKTNIDAVAAVLQRVGLHFAPHEQTIPDMTVRIDAGHIPKAGTLATEVAAQNTATITAPSTNPRKDIIYIDATTGIVGIATGTENASPVDPSLPQGKVAIARINITTSTAAIANSILDDIRTLLSSGSTPITEQFADSIDYTSGTSIQLTLNQSLDNENFLQIFFDGVAQHHNTFSITGTPTIITFSSAIPTGTANIEAVYGLSITSADGDLLAANNLSDVQNAINSFSNIKQVATQTVTGVIELATQTEVDAGTDTTRAVTPATLASLPSTGNAWSDLVNADIIPATDSLYDLGSTVKRFAEIHGDLLSIAGNITVTGTVDGRNIGTDGTKLDGIESNSTADQTNAEIETAYNAQVAIVPLAEAQAGTATTRRGWTASRVKSAIDALGGSGGLLPANNLSDVANAVTSFSNIKQAATASATGVVELATNAETLTGTDTTRATTPSNITAKLKSPGDGVIGGTTPAWASFKYIEIIRATADASLDFKTSAAEDFDCRIIQDNANGLDFLTGGNGATDIRMNIGANGKVFIGAGTAAASDRLNVVEGANAVNLQVDNTSASLSNVMISAAASRLANVAYWFYQGVSGGGDNEFLLRGDGTAFADISWNGGGADYAEYFEWDDGNLTNEDRNGVSVILVGNKIRPALFGESPIGVISANPSVVADSAWNKWTNKHLRDDFRNYIQEDYEVVEWIEEVTEIREKGPNVTKKQHSYATDEIPIGTTVPVDARRIVQQRRKVNPAFDPTQKYISREDRPEWTCVGLIGKLRIKKNQPTDARWIKMQDISPTVEEWLIR